MLQIRKVAQKLPSNFGTALVWPPCWIIMIIIRILLIIVRRRRHRRRRRRAVAPTSNTASHSYHEKIS